MFENSVVDHHWLVVLTCLTILKNMKVYESEWEGLSHILWKKTCSKPPTSHHLLNLNGTPSG